MFLHQPDWGFSRPLRDAVDARGSPASKVKLPGNRSGQGTTLSATDSRYVHGMHAVMNRYRGGA